MWDAAHRALLDELGSADRIGWERSDRLGRHRRVVEQTIARRKRCRRLAIGYERSEVTTRPSLPSHASSSATDASGG